MAHQVTLTLHLRTQALCQDPTGHNEWCTTTIAKKVPAATTAVLICDMWDQHWSRGAAERVSAMAPRLNQVVQVARARGALIIHAPSDTLDFYSDTPACQRVRVIPSVEPPLPGEHADPPLPIDDTDGGSDTGEAPWHKAWTRQHPAITIDQERDLLTDDGRQVYSSLRWHHTEQLLIMGVHTNMCVLGRSFGIRSMVRWGVPVALVRDLTDTMYNPARSPYVSHDEGTRLVIAYIEKFWCPTVASTDLLEDA
jgi:nicotinamidase-related amidase